MRRPLHALLASIALLTATAAPALAQDAGYAEADLPEQTLQVAPVDPEDFDLEGVAALVRDGGVQDAQGLQDLINQDNGLNNVDLDDDGLVDHVIVREVRQEGELAFEFVAVPSSNDKDPRAQVTVARLILNEQPAEQDVEVVAEYTEDVNDYDRYVYVYHVAHPRYAPAPLPFYAWAYAPGRPVWVWSYTPGYYSSYYYYSDYGTLVTVRSRCYHRYGVTHVSRRTYTTHHPHHHRRASSRRHAHYRTRQHADRIATSDRVHDRDRDYSRDRPTYRSAAPAPRRATSLRRNTTFTAARPNHPDVATAPRAASQATAAPRARVNTQRVNLSPTRRASAQAAPRQATTPRVTPRPSSAAPKKSVASKKRTASKKPTFTRTSARSSRKRR